MKIRHSIPFLLLVLLGGGSTAQAQAPSTVTAPIDHAHEYFAVEYLENRSFKPGNLVVDGDALKVLGNLKFRGQTVTYTVISTIPLTSIIAATDATRREDANRATALLLGLPVQTDNRDYVTITTETATEAKAFIFRVGTHTSADIVAKVMFAVKRAKS